ncbi:MAG TPA: phage major capsid protein, partial [Prolixibacteraceae bacterium]|nr:phage major capsid protein [Prolixibacteraceae bacterium]
LGANFITNLTGNLPLLKGGSFSAAWVPEGGNVNFTKKAFGKATMTPKNLMVAGAISKQLLVQTADVADRLIREELIKAIAHGLQAAAINGSGQDAQPYGILNTVGIGAVIGGENGAIPAWSHIVNLESEIANDNADLGEIKYLTNTKVRGILKQTLRSAGVSGYIWEGTQMNGYQALTSNVVPSNLEKGTSSVCSAIIAGVWSELFIGMWGGLDIVVDPFTRADFNEIKLVLNQFADVALRNAEAFAAMKDALTA